jgi:hypothetical protein
MAHGNTGKKNAKGNKGGGRKSAYQESKDAKFLQDVWEGDFDEAELKKIIASKKGKKRGAKHVFAMLALTGNEKILNKMVDKLFANKHDIALDDLRETPDDLTDQERESIEEAVNNTLYQDDE